MFVYVFLHTVNILLVFVSNLDFHIKNFLSYFGFYIDNVVTNGKSLIAKTICITFLRISGQTIFVYFVLFIVFLLSSLISFLAVSVCMSICVSLCLLASLSLCLLLCLSLFFFVFLSLFYGQFVLFFIDQFIKKHKPKNHNFENNNYVHIVTTVD